MDKIGIINESMVSDAITWIVGHGIKLIIALILLNIGWKFINKVQKYFDKFLEKKEVDASLRTFLEGIVNIGLKILVLLVLLPYVGIETAGLAAIVASAGVAIGLALQGSLSNFAGGVIILLLRPFKVGDYIEIPGYAGTVEAIKIFYTELVTTDNKVAMIPNGTLANQSLINYSKKSTRRVDLVFSVGYDDDIVAVKNILNDIIQNQPLILSDPAPFVAVAEHGASSINFTVRVWCESANYWTIYFDLLEKVKVRFDEEKITIPYPQMDIHMASSKTE